MYEDYLDYDPMSEEECTKARLNTVLEYGWWAGTILKAEQKLSKSGNLMLELQVRFLSPEKEEVLVKDWCVFTKKMMYKVRHLFCGAGLQSAYEAKKVNAAMLVGRELFAELEYEVARYDETGKQYPARNKIVDYALAPPDNTKENTSVKNEEFKDSDIPF